mgnify:CR=1 FL=1
MTFRMAEPLDLLVLGSGVAGLSAAVRAAGLGMRVGVLTKAGLDMATTRWAQGGVAAVLGMHVSAQTVVGHRGASYDAPENTLCAFELAWKQDADGIEGDFYVTKDKQVVCIHDPDTKRTGGKKLKVAESTLAQLRSLEYGAWKGPEFAGEPIPTFGQVLKAVPQGKLFVIELKTGPEMPPRSHWVKATTKPKMVGKMTSESVT